MEKCLMCKQEFNEKDLDFVGRCTECFKKYMTMPAHEKPHLNIPFTPVSKAIK